MENSNVKLTFHEAILKEAQKINRICYKSASSSTNQQSTFSRGGSKPPECEFVCETNKFIQAYHREANFTNDYFVAQDPHWCFIEKNVNNTQKSTELRNP